MDSLASRFLKDQDGATAIEYSIVVAGIALAVLGSIQLLGSVVFGWFTVLQSMP